MAFNSGRTDVDR